jgi:hypothetical protein
VIWREDILYLKASGQSSGDTAEKRRNSSGRVTDFSAEIRTAYVKNSTLES